MNPRNKISRYVIIAVVCAAIWMLNFSVSVNSVVGGIFDLKRGIEIVYNGRDHSFSSSSLRKRVAEAEGKKI